ncbi:hypothetical protein WR25_04942 [Diploscapter pachys]|uniref:Uncharacterized protein n=1 Tax=Diploscapter pachys TaxID=2018661 RepID=A0A2A2JQY9_9BILA|nr:hypothetical protein WR25_04942 [Diploscapter pachys]
MVHYYTRKPIPMSFLKSSVLLLVISGVCLGCDQWPNGTDKAIHWWECSNGPIKLYNVTVMNQNGQPEYPILLTAPIQVWIDIDNPTDTFTDPNLRAQVNLWSWNYAGCSWASVPTFGLLRDLNACDFATCPINPGRQWVKVTIDFTQFQPIINVLKDNMPYQLQLNLHDKASGDNVCVSFQAWCRTK